LPIIHVLQASQPWWRVRPGRLRDAFREDLDGGEERGEAGAVQLVRLLFLIALVTRMRRWRVARSRGRGDAGEELDLLVGDGLGEAFDALVLVGSDGSIGELFETGDQRSAKLWRP